MSSEFGVFVKGRAHNSHADFFRKLGNVTAQARRQSVAKESKNMRMRGKVRKWFAEKGFGFIRSDSDTEQDIFLHVSQLGGLKAIDEGTLIEFDVVADRRDPTRSRAAAVTLV
jgi:cold shock CspA family protein